MPQQAQKEFLVPLKNRKVPDVLIRITTKPDSVALLSHIIGALTRLSQKGEPRHDTPLLLALDRRVFAG